MSCECLFVVGQRLLVGVGPFEVGDDVAPKCEQVRHRDALAHTGEHVAHTHGLGVEVQQHLRVLGLADREALGAPVERELVAVESAALTGHGHAGGDALGVKVVDDLAVQFLEAREQVGVLGARLFACLRLTRQPTALDEVAERHPVATRAEDAGEAADGLRYGQVGHVAHGPRARSRCVRALGRNLVHPRGDCLHPHGWPESRSRLVTAPNSSATRANSARLRFRRAPIFLFLRPSATR